MAALVPVTVGRVEAIQVTVDHLGGAESDRLGEYAYELNVFTGAYDRKRGLFVSCLAARHHRLLGLFVFAALVLLVAG